MRMRRRGSLLSLLSVVTVLALVISLLFFFYYDTGLHRHKSALWKRQSGTSKKVILSSLGFSSPSIAGDLLSHGPNVYYVFEPLKQPAHAMTTFYHLSNNTAKAAILVNWRTQARNILHSLLSCDFQDLDLSLLAESAIPRPCPEHVTPSTANPMSQTDCWAHAQRLCQDAKVIVLEVLRLRIRDLEPLLARHPELVLILLVRDPRATTWSANLFTQAEQPGDSSTRVHSFCNGLEDDANVALDLNRHFSGRVKVLHYETLTKDALKSSQLLYHFAGIEWNHQVESFVQNRTGLSRKESGVSAAEAMYASQSSGVHEEFYPIANIWRKSANWHFVEMVQEKCFGVMRQLGYLLFRSEGDLRDNVTWFYDFQKAAIEENEILLQINQPVV